MRQAESWARVKTCHFMMVAFIIGSIYAVYEGKQIAKSGDTPTARTLEWHRQLQEEGKRDMALAESMKKS